MVASPSRIIIHDFPGHQFPLELSRELSNRGHSILHLHFPGFQSPKGNLNTLADDPESLQIRPVTITHEYAKYSVCRRLMNDWEYVRAFMRHVEEFKPTIILSSCASPFAQNWLRRRCYRQGIPFVAWIQDLYGRGISAIIQRKLGLVGKLPSLLLARLEDPIVRGSDGVVFVSQSFEDAFESVRSGAKGKWHVVENWAPIHGLPQRPKVNPWSLANGLSTKTVFLYTGTLGFKHNPELLVQLARQFHDVDDVVVVVVSQGLGRTYLDQRKSALGLNNLRLFDFQGFESLPDVVATGDVLVAMIERDAARFSVPSKVLSYLCAARPLLLSVPRTNAAAEIVERIGAGFVVEPDNIEGFLKAAGSILADPARAAAFARRGREYAEATFRIETIASKFEAILREAVVNQRLSNPS